MTAVKKGFCCPAGNAGETGRKAGFLRGLRVVDWHQIMKKHGPAVWGTAYRLLGNDADAADCFQETFVSALEVSRRQHVRNFPALLVRLATARAIDHLRRRTRGLQAQTNVLDPALRPSDNPGPGHSLQTMELAGKLREAIAQLPPKQAQVFCMRTFNDMSYRQIARQLGITRNTTGVLLNRAKRKLRNILEPALAEEQKVR